MEVQGSADEIVPSMLAFLKEQTATGAASEGGERSTPQQPTAASATVTDADRDL